MPTPALSCDVILPCRDEAPALPALLGRVPTEYGVIVVDNGSRDGTARVARELGARVVQEDRPGYGAAVHAGVAASAADLVAVLDGDGSLDPAELPPLVDDAAGGRCRLAVGRRRPVADAGWPWHARAGSAAVARLVRARTGSDVHDIAPMRVCGRRDLLDLELRDRRYGYPVELLVRAARAGWTIREHDVTYHSRASGTVSKVSGTVTGSLRAALDFARQLA